MSQMFGLKGNNADNLIMMIDNRACIEFDGNKYTRETPIKKYAIGKNNRLYVCFGTAYAIDGAVHAIENLGLTDLKEICMNATPEQFREKSEEQAKKEGLLSVFKLDFENERMIIRACHFKEFSYEGLYEHSSDITNSGYIHFGIHSEEIEKWYQEYFDNYIQTNLQGVEISDIFKTSRRLAP